MNSLDDEQRAIQRGRARFEADVAQTVRVIAERYRAHGMTLNGDTARAILDEALADVGLASRWPADLLAPLAATVELPPDDAALSGDGGNLHPLIQPLFDAFDTQVEH